MSRRFFQFVLVGTIGFIVDTGVLYLLLYTTALGFYGSRLCSIALAASVTWLGNRLFTFADHDHTRHHPAHQWGRFVAVSSGGALINYGIYSALIATVAFIRAWPVIGVAVGGLAGLAFNYNMSRRLVFFEHKDDKRPG